MNLSRSRRIGAALAISVLALVCVASRATAQDARNTDAAKQEPRHGTRAKASDGTLLVYDKVSGYYLVPSHKNTFWIDERFYQHDNGVWLGSAAIAGPWELVPRHLIPQIALERFPAPKVSVTAKLPSGRDAVFEPRLKVYKVAGQKGVFLFDGLFYRYDTGVWLESKTDDGPWKPTSMKILPVMLRKAVPVPADGSEVALPSGDKIVYSAQDKFFSVAGKPDTLFFDGAFYEKHEDKWFTSEKATSGFAEIVLAKVPQPVRAKYYKGPAPGAKTAVKAVRDKAAGQKKAGGGAVKKPAKPAAAGTGKPAAHSKKTSDTRGEDEAE
jgi:hypothetical protein